MNTDPLLPFNGDTAPLARPGAVPGLRKPHAWAATFATLCRTLDSRRTSFTAVRDVWNASSARGEARRAGD